MTRLPPELELKIFETAIYASPTDAKLRINLMSVARRIRTWIEPFAYRYLVFSKYKTWRRLRRIIAPKPPDFLARHVKSVCMPPGTVSMREAGKILTLCTGVERLACWIDHRVLHEYEDAANVLVFPSSIPLHTLTQPLRRLSIELSHFLALPTALPALNKHLTHLELVYWEEHAGYYPPAINLAHFASLTHLALRSSALPTRFLWPIETVASMRATCRRLKLLVLLDYVALGSAHRVQRMLQDRRAVVLGCGLALMDWEPEGKPMHRVRDWMSKTDMWTRGEALLRLDPSGF